MYECIYDNENERQQTKIYYSLQKKTNAKINHSYSL